MLVSYSRRVSKQSVRRSIHAKNKDYIQIQTFPFSGLPRSALKSVTTSKTVIASVRTRDTSTNHTSRAVSCAVESS